MDDLDKAKRSAQRLLAFRPRSESEMRKRLAQKGVSAEAVEQVVADLKREGGLNDEVYARLYALSRMQSRAFGKGRVRRELTLRGLKSDEIARAMEAVSDIDERSLAKELAVKRLPSMKGLAKDAKKRRLHGLLLRRGFAAGTVFKVLGELLGNEGNEDF